MDEEKDGKQAVQDTAPLETNHDPYYDLKRSVVAEENRVNVLPQYETGLIQRCPYNLQGKDALAATMLEGLAAYLQSSKWDSDEMEELLGLADTSPPKVTGIWKLNGGRYEFFVQAGSYLPTAFKSRLKYSEEFRRGTPGLELTDDDLSKLVVIILDFVKKRVQYLIPPIYELQNFGYIISRGPVKEHDMHIDLNSKSQYQLGMMCCHKLELTSEFMCDDKSVVMEEGSNLQTYWHDMPHGLQQKLDRFPEIQGLVNGYGALLAPSIKRVGWTRGKPPKVVDFGTILMLPGRISTMDQHYYYLNLYFDCYTVIRSRP
jgi:hypothetical protein